MTTSPSDGSTLTGRYAELESHVADKVERIQKKYVNQDWNASRDAAASLAKLRRAVNMAPGSDPSVWRETLEGLPQQFQGPEDGPSAEERAVHAAITLFALHQQSQTAFYAHKRRQSFGHAASALAKQVGEDPVLRRFQTLATATAFEETVHHARAMIGQFRAKKIPLDYGGFAVDLARLQSQASADGVRLKWGRDYYFRSPASATDSDATPNGEEK
ncbi:type I-E CRISPR-associated protein Cse2/CasB [Okibacterium endophyticum]